MQENVIKSLFPPQRTRNDMGIPYRKFNLSYTTIEQQDELFAYNANHTYDNAYNKSTANTH
jgi:hypothetical protein